MIRDSSTMDRAVERAGWFNTRNRYLLGVGVLTVIGLAVLLPSIRRWARSETSVSLARVRIGEATLGDLVRDVAVEGRVVAAYHPTLFSPVGGIAGLLVRPGDSVSEGQELVIVESPDLESEWRREISNLSAAEAGLERQRILAEQTGLQNEQSVGLLEVELEAARRGMERAQRSRDEGLLNAVEYERAQDAVRVSELKLEVAKKKTDFEVDSLSFEVKNRASQVETQRLLVEDLRRRVEQLNVRSPASGMISRVLIDDRDAVGANQALVTVVDLSAFEIEIFVPETYADDVSLPTTANIQFEGKEFLGEVKSISPEVEGSRVRGTVAFLGDLPEGLKQNQRVSIRLVLDSRDNVVKVPRGPFVESGGGRRAYVIEDGMALLRPIEVGGMSITEVEITAGLEPGERIIISDMGRFGDAKSILLRD